MPIISAVGLFCYDKFEETPNEKVVNMSKLTKSYFKLMIKESTVFGPPLHYTFKVHSLDQK